MTIEKLISLHHAQPFRAFRIHVADGGHVDVPHPDFLAHTPTGRTVVVTKLDETFEVIDLLLVSRLEVLNGRATRGRRRK